MGVRICAALVVALLASCRKHIEVSSVPRLPYPSCGHGPLPVGDVLASQHLRSGPTSLERDIVEHYQIHRRDCLFVADSRQEWSRSIADVQVVYDDHWHPLRVWKRMTIPGDRRPDGHADIRRYELRGADVTITKRGPDGVTHYEILRGAHPEVVIAPGRGLITAWLQRAHLAVGGRVRQPAIDVREQVEVLRPVTLQREPDMFLPWLGRSARVYTFYGRETVFADEHDVVIGDLAGLRQAELLHTPEPPPMPLYGMPDPMNTP